MEEYAAIFCTSEDPYAALPDNPTWREVRAVAQAELDNDNTIEPPEAVRDFHLAALAYSQAFLDASADFDQDAVMDLEQLADDETLWSLWSEYRASIEGLDSSVWGALLVAGCNV